MIIAGFIWFIVYGSGILNIVRRSAGSSIGIDSVGSLQLKSMEG